METEKQVLSDSRGRRESFEEKLDRNWNDLLQELRVMQTGAQIITAFLMTLPFQSKFDDLGDFQRWFYIVLLSFSALLTGLILTPVAIHRKLFGKHVKAATVAHGHRIVKIALLGLGLMVSACVYFIVDVLISWDMALYIGGGVLLVIAFLLVLLPRILKPVGREGSGGEEDAPGLRPEDGNGTGFREDQHDGGGQGAFHINRTHGGGED